jgi:chromosome segregation ATPase
MKFIFAHILAVLLARDATCDVTDADDGCESQDDALNQMQRQLKSQHDVMLQLQARLDVYESRLMKQEGVIRQQEKQLLAQELRMTRQDKQSLRERETISRICAELDMNENEDDMTETHEDGFSVNTDDQLKQQQLDNMPSAAEFTDSLKDAVHDDFTASHDVKARADDLGSLEVTVIQMGQQLNAMGADI